MTTILIAWLVVAFGAAGLWCAAIECAYWWHGASPGRRIVAQVVAVAVGAAALLLVLGCVNGLDVTEPGDPEFAALCIDSTLVDTTRACWWPPGTAVEVTVPNPNYPGPNYLDGPS